MEHLKTLAITCGGTGGHFYPGLSIAREFRECGGEVELLLSGVNAARQCEIAESFGISAMELPRMPSPKASPWGFVAGLAGGFSGARRKLRELRPQLLLGMGSFASLPAILAARSLGIAYALHDGNARIGRANRILSRGSLLLGTGFPPVNGGKIHCPLEVTGMPVRPELRKSVGITRQEAIDGLNREFGRHFEPETPIVLIFGGSQGAAVFNTVFPAVLRRMAGEFPLQVLHLAGTKQFDATRARYEDAPFPHLVLGASEKMELFLGAADLVICRSGGSTVAELALFGKASVLIPYPYAAELHQNDNADFLASAGGALKLENAACTEERAEEILRDFFTFPERWRERGRVAATLARPDAARMLLELLDRKIGDAQP